MQAWLLYIRLVLVTTFVGSYAMAMIHHHEVAVHARYMVRTGLSLIDPVFSRLVLRLFERSEAINDPGLAFGLVWLILLVLIRMERHARAGRRVFATMLAIDFLPSLPLVFDFSRWGPIWQPWKSITAAFAALPIP